MCGREITQGILCDKCDKPRKKTSDAGVPEVAAPASSARATQPAPAVTAAPAPPPQQSNPQPASRSAVALDPFPKAQVVPFPVESASPAITSIASVLIATGVASVVVGPDRAVKFVTDEAKRLFDAPQSDLSKLSFIEAAAALRVGDLAVPASSATRIRHRNVLYSLVPLSGGASGAVLVFRPADETDGHHASFMAFVRETIFSPLRALHDSMIAASRTNQHDPMLVDFAGTVDQILSSLEMAPEVEEGITSRSLPTVSDVVRTVAERFVPFADLKNIKLEVDVPELSETFRDHPQLADALGVLMDNSLHYVPPGGQVVIGARWMEHKGKPLLLFFVMDNGPIVPEELRQSIFEPGFVWQPAAPERTGRSLFRCREFAVAHGGSIWVESKTGKACTFFLRVRPN
ncbi:MAG TPA: HAMP domain-containing sensor histidine kinase [Thermoanaerobaculia bacterium]|nr:HAMP domain-containing sensor histidine kinase [Thermoanaerobaculia bacterium]